VSASSLSLPRAERTISLFALLVAPALAALAAFSPRLAIYVLAAAIAVFIVFRSLLAGLALFIVLTFPDQLPGALDVGPTLAKPLGIVILISWLLMIVGDRERSIPFLARDAPVLTYALLAFLVWALASMIWASDRSATLDNLSRLIQLVGLVFVTYSAVRKARDLLILVWALIGGALVTSVYALANGTVHYGRLTGGIFDANSFAAEMVVGLVLAVFLLISARTASLRLLLLAFLAPLGLAFVETQSRSGLIALAAAFLTGIVLAGPVRGRFAAVILIATAIGLAYYVYAAPSQFRERVTSIATGGRANPLREDTWHIALRMARAHPVVGIGLGNFPTGESRYLISNLDVRQVDTLRHYQLVAHNTYLEILAELGIVGLTLFSAVVAMTLGRALVMLGKPGPRDETVGLCTRALSAATIGLMTSQVFISGEYSKQLWLLFGMVVAAASLGGQGRPVRSPTLEYAAVRLGHVPAA
jgi:O-antigen ligase